MQIHKTGNPSYLYRLKSYSNLPVPESDMGDLWFKVYDEYIGEFGLNEQYKDYLRKKVQIALMKCDKVTEDNNALDTMIEINEIDLREMLDTKQSAKFIDIVAAMKKFMGFNMDMKVISTMEYYSYLRAMERSVDNG